jgi:hypothetical protein
MNDHPIDKILVNRSYEIPNFLHFFIKSTSNISGLHFKRKAEFAADLDEKLSILLDNKIIEKYGVYPVINYLEMKLDVNILTKQKKYLLGYYIIENKFKCEINRFDLSVSFLNKTIFKIS